MALPPGRGHRVCLVHHERINTSPADRPGRRQTGRARADDHDRRVDDGERTSWTWPRPGRVVASTQSG